MESAGEEGAVCASSSPRGASSEGSSLWGVCQLCVCAFTRWVWRHAYALVGATPLECG
jgi:hypothetical protein